MYVLWTNGNELDLDHLFKPHAPKDPPAKLGTFTYLPTYPVHLGALVGRHKHERTRFGYFVNLHVILLDYPLCPMLHAPSTVPSPYWP
jgi:hypothetical protein